MLKLSNLKILKFNFLFIFLGVTTVSFFSSSIIAKSQTEGESGLDRRLIAYYKQLEKDNIRTALKYLHQNSEEAQRRFAPQFLHQVAQALESDELEKLANLEGPTVQVGDDQVVTLQSDYIRLAELGASIRARNSRENLIQQYWQAYMLAPYEIQVQFLHPTKLLDLNLIAVKKELNLIILELNTSTVTRYLARVNRPPTQATCEAEIGYEDGTDQDFGTCGSYATNGIMRNIAFPLRDDLTCVRNQGCRGTCVAFGSTAAIETGVHVMNGNKVTLSEQHAYWYGETTVGFDGRYTYGLNTFDFLENLENTGYELPEEKIWDYNPSSRIVPKIWNEDTYPNSCDEYSGGECTDFAFQGDEIEVDNGFGGVVAYIHPNPTPNAGSFGVNQAIEIGTSANDLTYAQVLLHAEVPLVVSIDVTPNFNNPDANGYVTYNPVEPVLGGHAMHVAGWVCNADLPAGAPPGSGGGYFVLKNSWGDFVSDCGYYYVPYNFLLIHGRSLISVVIN